MVEMLSKLWIRAGKFSYSVHPAPPLRRRNATVAFAFDGG
jgi:hypothetical protein